MLYMTNCRATIKCPTLSQFPARGISPDELKTMKKSDIEAQSKINDNFNNRAIELGNILTSKLTDVDISWCNDGCFVISCSNTAIELEKVIADEGLEVQPDRSDIKHKLKQIDPSNINSESHQDIDVIFEPKTIGEKKLLKETPRVNNYQLMKTV